MKHYMRLLSALSAGSLLGCSQISQLPGLGGAAVVSGLHASVPTGTPQTQSVPAAEMEGLFVEGRAAHGAGDLARAEQLYTRVIEGNPAHQGALNSLAVIYAQTQRMDKAEVFFRRALVLDPKASHVHNNYGYALLTVGRLAEAEVQLGTAQTLNPSSQKTRQNIELLTRAKELAAALQPPNGTPAPQVATPQLVVVAPHVYELRDQHVSTAGATQLSQPEAQKTVQIDGKQVTVGAELAATMVLRGVRLEVSNGVGVSRLAKRTAQRLVPTGVNVVRLTNQPGYRQLKTQIQFSPGNGLAAAALSGKLYGAIPAVPADTLTRNVQVRLILGRDLIGTAFAAWLDGPDDVQVATAGFDGWRWS